MNPIAANTWIWTGPLDDDGLRTLVPKVSGLGFDAIELPVETAGDWDRGLAAELLARHGLGAGLCAAFPPGRDLLADVEALRSTQEFLRTCVDIAVRIGATVVGGPMYCAVGRRWLLAAADRPATLAQLVTALRPIVDYAAEHGVTLALEPLNRYETSLINTVEQGLEVVAAVDSPALGLLLDTYHMNIEEKDPAAAIRLAGPHIAHVHASASDRGAPGADHVDWAGVASALRAVGYAGTLCIEAFTPEQPALAEGAHIWRSVARTQDDLARDGLAFLRALPDRARALDPE